MQTANVLSVPALTMDTSEKRTVHLLVGQNGAYMRLSSSAHLLLQQVDRGVSFDSLATTLSASGTRSISAAEVAAAYYDLRARIAAIEQQTEGLGGGFWFRRALLPAALVARLAAPLSRAFHPALAAPLVCAIFAAAGLVMRFGLSVGTDYFWSGYGLFLISLLCHELGHASACARYGAAPSEIGLTAYLIYPAFYSNVSAAWALRRWQRVLVDLGGVYFQLLFAAACAVAYALLRLESLRLCLVLIIGSCALSLNPILKFDGYWLLADALGVTNLGQQPARIYRDLLQRLRRQPAPPLPWPASVTVALVVYTAATTGFWLFFFHRLLPVLWTCARAYPSMVVGLTKAVLQLGHRPSWAELQSFLSSTYLLFFILFVCIRLARSGLRRICGPGRGGG